MPFYKLLGTRPGCWSRAVETAPVRPAATKSACAGCPELLHTSARLAYALQPASASSCGAALRRGFSRQPPWLPHHERLEALAFEVVGVA